MREVDRIMVEDFGISLVQMMENAGSCLAEMVWATYRPDSVTVLAGSGGNGGGGMVAGRHLANRGVDVAVAVIRDDLDGVTAKQLQILRRMGVAIGEPRASDVVIDALIGYSLRGAPVGRAAELIGWANRQAVPVVALDAPSGVDVDTGAAAGEAIRATATVTLGLPKPGLAANQLVGDLWLADISIPPAAFARIGVAVDGLFDDHRLRRL